MNEGSELYPREFRVNGMSGVGEKGEQCACLSAGVGHYECRVRVVHKRACGELYGCECRVTYLCARVCLYECRAVLNLNRRLQVGPPAHLFGDPPLFFLITF